MRFTVLFILLLSSIPCLSQNCDNSLSGTLSDLHDGSLLIGATLVIADTDQAVTTDFDGRFTFENLCEQSYNIQISHPSCTTKVVLVKVKGATVKNFKLEHHLEELNQVIVDGKTIDTQTNTILENSISTAELEKYSSATIGDALNSISGVSSLNTGNAIVKPMINGLHSSRVVIINNGVRMEDQEWGSEHAPNLDVNAIGNLTLIKGAGALQYGGDAVGGVIVAETAKVPVEDNLFGKTLLTGGTNGRGGTVTTELTKSYESGWYAKGQGSLKRFGDFEAPDYVLSNTGVFERNASFQLGLNKFNSGFEAYYSIYKNEIGILRASHLGGAQDQVNAINSDVPLVIRDFTYDINAPKQDVTHNLARIKAFKRYDGLGKLSVQYDFQRNNRLEYDIRRGDDKYKASIDLRLDTHTLLLDIDSEIYDMINLKYGVNGSFQNNFANPETGVRRLIPDYDKFDAGIYLVADYAVNDQLLLEAGGRFDYTYMNAFKYYRTSFWELRNYDELYPDIVVEELANQVLTNPQLNFYNGSATFGANYNFDKGFNLLLNLSIASRAPNPSELFSEGLHHSASRIEYGDLSFKSEVGNKVALALQRDNPVFSFSINPYLNKINNFIVIEPTSVQQTIRGNFQVWEYRQTDAQLIGIDLDASLAFMRNFVLNSQLAYVRGTDLSRDEPLINMPPLNIKNELVYRNFDFKNLRLSIESQYFAKQGRYPDNNFEIYIPETQTEELVDISTPPDAYHLLNFSSSIDFNINTKSTLTLGLMVTNVLDKSYRNYLNRLRYYADDLGRNILLNLKINY